MHTSQHLKTIIFRTKLLLDKKKIQLYKREKNKQKKNKVFKKIKVQK